MYMLAEAMGVDPILTRYGGITYRLADAPQRDWVGALGTLDQVRAWRSDGDVTIEARNMVQQEARYTAQILDPNGNPVAAAAADFPQHGHERISVSLPAS